MSELSEKIRVELQDNYLHKMCGFCIQDMKPPLTSLTTDSVKNILSLIAAADEANAKWVTALKPFGITVDSPEALAGAVQVLLDEERNKRKVPCLGDSFMEYTLVVRHCALEDTFDDGGYCDRKIKKFDSYYWMGVPDGNGERMCSECSVRTILQQLSLGGCIPEYVDKWNEDMQFLGGKA